VSRRGRARGSGSGCRGRWGGGGGLGEPALGDLVAVGEGGLDGGQAAADPEDADVAVVEEVVVAPPPAAAVGRDVPRQGDLHGPLHGGGGGRGRWEWGLGGFVSWGRGWLSTGSVALEKKRGKRWCLVAGSVAPRVLDQGRPVASGGAMRRRRVRRRGRQAASF
jgi:hypothetical protein